jgi:hypothetical protein
MRLSELTNEAEQPSAAEVKSYKKLTCSAKNAFEAYAVFKTGKREISLAQKHLFAGSRRNNY